MLVNHAAAAAQAQQPAPAPKPSRAFVFAEAAAAGSLLRLGLAAATQYMLLCGYCCCAAVAGRCAALANAHCAAASSAFSHRKPEIYAANRRWMHDASSAQCLLFNVMPRDSRARLFDGCKVCRE